MKLRSLWPLAVMALILSVGVFPDQWNDALGIQGTSVYGPEQRAWAGHEGGFREADVRAAALGEVEPLTFAPQAACSTPAFPEAEGYGAVALCNYRDSSRVWKVTDLGDTGDGTLRAILEDSIVSKVGLLNVVAFDTAGVINLASTVRDPSGNPDPLQGVYIAGQYAPGQIVIRGGRIWLGEDEDRGIVVRYIRREGSGTQAFVFRNADSVIVDHVSCRWASDTCWRMSGDSVGTTERMTHVTSQWNMLYWANGASGLAVQISGAPDSEPATRFVTDANNYYTSNKRRNPIVATKEVEVIQNYCHNYFDACVHTNNDDQVAITRSFFSGGPGTPGDAYPIEVDDGCDDEANDDNVCLNNLFLEKNASIERNSQDTTDTATEQVDGSGSGRIVADWDDGSELPIANAENDVAGTGTHLDSVFLMASITNARTEPTFPVTPLALDSASFDARLNSVGAFQRLTASGAWTNARDAHDSTAVAEARTGGGLTSIPTQGSTPTLDVGSGYTDTDTDGVPDDWENQEFGDLNSDEDGDPDEDDYLNIEEYLNGTDPNVAEGGATTTFGTGVNIYVCREFDTVAVSPTRDDIRCAGVGPEEGGLRGPMNADSMLWRVQGITSPTDGTLLDSAGVVDRCDGTPWVCDIDRLRDADRTPSAMVPQETPKPENPPKIEHRLALAKVS